MATCQEVIEEALYEIGAVGIGEAFEAAEVAAGLRVLQSLYDGMVSSGKFGRAIEVLEDADYEAGEGERVFNSSGSAITVSLPETISAADSETGEERPPHDYELIRVAGDPTQTYIYSAPLGDWVQMTGLALTDDAPLSERDMHGLACVLGLRLTRRAKAEIGQTTVTAASQFMSSLSLKFDAPRRTVEMVDY